MITAIFIFTLIASFDTVTHPILTWSQFDFVRIHLVLQSKACNARHCSFELHLVPWEETLGRNKAKLCLFPKIKSINRPAPWLNWCCRAPGMTPSLIQYVAYLNFLHPCTVLCQRGVTKGMQDPLTQFILSFLLVSWKSAALPGRSVTVITSDASSSVFGSLRIPDSAGMPHDGYGVLANPVYISFALFVILRHVIIWSLCIVSQRPLNSDDYR